MGDILAYALDFVWATLAQSGIYAIVALGLVITFQVIRFPDLTPDGSFTLGGAIAAQAIITIHSPFGGLIGIAYAFMAGGMAGYLTGFLSVRIKINRILCGILVATMLYSISLWVMGRGNIPLLKGFTIFTPFEGGLLGDIIPSLLLFFIAILASVCIWALLRSDIGLLLRATGQNAHIVKGSAKNSDLYTLLGVALSNSLIALGGGLAAQQYGFADINLGLGTLVSGLACLFLGEALVRPRSPRSLLVAAIVGSLIYVIVRNIALRLGFGASDLKFVTAMIVIIVLVCRRGGGDRHALPEDLF